MGQNNTARMLDIINDSLTKLEILHQCNVYSFNDLHSVQYLTNVQIILKLWYQFNAK